MWVYRREDGHFVTGYYSPDQKWHTDKKYEDQEEAAARVHYLNGGGADTEVAEAARRGFHS